MHFLEAMKNHAEFLAPKVAVALVVFCVVWLIAVVAHRITRAVIEKAKIQSGAVTLFGRLVYWGLLVIGFVLALGVAGVNVGAMIAGLGLASLAVGVALQATLSNMFAGALIMLYQPFHPGNRIRTQSVEGEVLAINLRYTLLQGDKSIIMIPNATFFSNPVVIIKTES